MSDRCVIQELMAATGRTKHDLKKLLCGAIARPDGSPSSSRAKGRPATSYLVSQLPEDLRNSLAVYRQGENHPCQVGHSKIDPLKLSEKEAGLCMAKASLVSQYRNFIALCGRGNIQKAKDEFARLYNLGEYGSDPKLFETTGPVSLKSIERWDLILRNNDDDSFSLADRRGKHRLGRTTVSLEQGQIFSSTYMRPNHPNIEQTIRVARIRMKAAGIDDWQTDRTYRNWLTGYIKAHYDQVMFQRYGEKARQEACEPTIPRDWDRIEVGDVLFADGKTLNFESLNPATGKGKRHHIIQWMDAKSSMPLGWEISRSESTEAIAVSLYRAILTLGKIPKVVYLDNGKAFRSKFFSGTKDFRLEAFVGAFKQLGIHVIFANPYNARTKTIERLHRTMDDFERRVYTFTGTSIADKPPRLKRGAEKFHKARYAHQFQGRLPTNEEIDAAYRRWLLDEYGQRPQRGHLRGVTPLEVFMEGRGPGFSEEQKTSLRILMACLEIRTIKRDGIKLPGSDIKYYHPDLYGLQLHGALVRYDWTDRSKIFVYTLGGDPICIAEPRNKVHPAAAYLGTNEDKLELEKQIALQRGLKKQTLGPARAIFDTSIKPELEQLQQNLGITGVLPASSITRKPAAPAESQIEPARLSDAALAEIERGVAELTSANAELDLAPWEKARSLNDADRYEELLEIQAKGIELPASEKAWLALFERSESYRRHKEYFDEHQTKLALRYGG